MRFQLAFLIFIAMTISAHSQERTMVVLDASGSMWGQLQGTTKMDIAKKSVKELFGKWSSQGNVNAGLTVYGHRRKGDCSDIELLADVGKINPAQLNARIDAIKPKGKTPLSAAVIQAAEAMKYDELKATVILVSDGIETCEMDPCEVGKRLEASGVDFVTHVIGFDIAAESDRAKLRCLAENTGGIFTPASNADELTQSLDTLAQFDADLIVPPEVEAGFSFDAVWNGLDLPGFSGEAFTL